MKRFIAVFISLILLFSLFPAVYAGAAEESELDYTLVTPPYSETAALTSDAGLSERWTYAKGYSFYADEGMAVTITLDSDDFDAYLFLLDADKTILAEDDDSGGGSNSRIYYVLPYSGLYYVQATQFTSGAGSFEISISVSEELTDGGVVSDWSGLKSWLSMYMYDGGTVYLGADIEINGECFIGLSSGLGEPIVIETGPYGLIVNGFLTIYGNVTISGNGSPRPVVRICNGGGLVVRSMDDYEKAVSIEAAGAGGTALKLESGAGYGGTNDGINYTAEHFTKLAASGPDSIAIDSAITLNMENHYIDASGSGARGIVSTEPVSMYLSVVTANGAAVSTTGDVTLDTCLLSPGVAEATTVNRKATGATSLYGQVQSVSAGKETTGYFSEGIYRIYLGADGLPDRVINSRVKLNDSAVDYNTPGRYYIPLVSLTSKPYDAFDIISTTSPAYLPVDIIDPHIPYLNQMRYVSPYWGSSYYLIEHLYSGDEELTLWYTEDDGENWSVLWRSGDEAGDAFEVEIYPDDITIYIYDETGFPSPAWFAYEVGAGKGSDAFCIDLEELRELGELGGDRTGGDRYQKPWEVIIGGGNNDDDNNNSDVNDDNDDNDANGSGGNSGNSGDGNKTTPPDTKPGAETSGQNNNPVTTLLSHVSGANNNRSQQPQQPQQDGALILEPVNPLPPTDTPTKPGNIAQPYGNIVVGNLTVGTDGNYYFDLDSSGKPLELVYDINFEDFDGLYINGILWTPGVDYTVRSGSTIITISAARLAQLGEGTHTLTAIFAGEPVEIVFSLNAPEAPDIREPLIPDVLLPSLPAEQSDPVSSFPVLLVTLSIIGVGGGAGLVFLLRQRRVYIAR